MRNKRMFSMDVIDTDAFLDMPVTSQSLYFHLGMRADDDGFVSSPKKIIRTIGCSADDLQVLISNQFIIPFNSGVVVIADWKTNNYLRPDRYTGTRYVAEKNMLTLNNGRYELTLDGVQSGIPDCVQSGIPDANQCVTQKRIETEEKKYIVEQSPTAHLFREIIGYLNEKTGKNFKSGSSASKRHINARLSEGFTLEDFKKVIDIKCKEWSGGKMEKYLRPETLFGSKFESYLNECHYSESRQKEPDLEEEDEEPIDYSDVERTW